jgi:hypothetical protein
MMNAVLELNIDEKDDEAFLFVLKEHCRLFRILQSRAKRSSATPEKLEDLLNRAHAIALSGKFRNEP